MLTGMTLLYRRYFYD